MMGLLNWFRRRKATNPDHPGQILAGGPDSVEVSARRVRVGDDHVATLVVTGYPGEVGAGCLDPLLSYPGRLDIAVHITPIPPVVAAQGLKKQRGRLESSRRQDAARGRLDDPDLAAAVFDATDLATRLARGEVRMFRVDLVLSVHGSTEQELETRVAEVRDLAASMLLTTAPVTWRQLQGWISTLPLGVDVVGMRRVFDTTALAAMFPFTSADLPTTSPTTGRSVLYGLNLASSGVVVWDRWAQDTYNMIVLARSGAGKSFFVKQDLLRNLFHNIEILVVDGEDEYPPLAEAVGGTVIRPGAPGVHINPLDLNLGDGADAVYRRAQFLQTFAAVALTGTAERLDPGTQGLLTDAADALDTAVLAAYRNVGITLDPRSWRRPAPLLGDVLTLLAQGDDPAGRNLASRLRRFVSGSFSGLFDGPTSTSPEGHLVVYAIKELTDELKPVGTLLALDAIWRRVATSAPDELQMILVDEAWMMLRAGLGAQFLFRLAKSARKYGAGLTVVTQDAADVLSTDVGRAVASNAATQVLLRQAPQAIATVAEAFDLTDGEREFLLRAGRGDALLVSGRNRVAFHTVAGTELSLLLTGPESRVTT